MIQVQIVHEIRLVCNALANVLRDEADIRVVGLASCIEDAKAQLEMRPCDVILVNVSRPSQHILKYIQEVAQKHTETKVLVVGVIEAEEFILQCFQAGAVGYALRNDSLEELLRKIRAAYHGKTFVSPEIAGALVSRVAELSRFVTNVDGDENNFSLLSAELTPREREVLRYLERGSSNQNIAEALTIEVGTVKNHVHNILKKLNVDNRKRAAMLARQVLPDYQPEPSIARDRVSQRMPQTTPLTYGARSLYRREAERSAV
jgi:DNA-binding NarL/FixJ family response regulator